MRWARLRVTVCFVALLSAVTVTSAGASADSAPPPVPTSSTADEPVEAGAPVEPGASGTASPPCFPGECTTVAVAEGDPRPAKPGGSTFSASGPGWAATCTGANQDPHYSTGAGGVIYKTDISCKGYGVTQVNVRYQGGLTFAPSIGCSTSNLAWRTRAQSDYYQWIGVTTIGAVKTFYAPRPGSHGGEGLGWWGTSSTWYFTHSGVRSTIGKHVKFVCKDLRP